MNREYPNRIQKCKNGFASPKKSFFATLGNSWSAAATGWHRPDFVSLMRSGSDKLDDEHGPNLSVAVAAADDQDTVPSDFRKMDDKPVY